MRVVLLCFGKLKTPGLRDSADYYSKLLRSWVQLEEIELKPIPVPDKSPATRKKIQEQEGAMVLEKVEGMSSRSEIYLLDETGKALPTLQWAERVRGWEDSSVPQIVLVIGSSLGFSGELRKRAKGSFSLGSQTMSHELARVVLYEQLYRAWSVNRGHPYHNEGS